LFASLVGLLLNEEEDGDDEELDAVVVVSGGLFIKWSLILHATTFSNCEVDKIYN
jgi:hypothetical protein